MYVVTVVVMLLFLGLLILASGQEVPEDAGILFRPFYKCAGYLYKKVSLWFPGAFRSKEVEVNLQRLNPGKSGEILQTDYYVKKFALCIGVTVVGSLLASVAKFSGENSMILENGTVTRGEYREGEREIQVAADYEEDSYVFSLSIEPRRLSEAETEELFDEVLQALPEMILGENESLDEVHSDLMLEDAYVDYPVGVEWKSNRPDVLGRSGRVRVQECPVLVELTVTLSYGEYTRESRLKVTVVSPSMEQDEALRHGLSALLQASGVASAEKVEWVLPTSWHGKEISWKQVVEDNSVKIGGATVAVVILVYALADRDLREKLEKRKKKLQLAYPELVHKLVLFMGAGMTIRGAFLKIATEVKEGTPIWEEMQYTCHELSSGISEGAAYEHFGKRTGMQEYIRLSTLLMQNLKRGNSTLLERLREEADKAAELRLQQSKKLSEEATTKLLLPMVMMLAVVMVIIMAPAFSAM